MKTILLIIVIILLFIFLFNIGKQRVLGGDYTSIRKYSNDINQAYKASNELFREMLNVLVDKNDKSLTINETFKLLSKTEFHAIAEAILTARDKAKPFTRIVVNPSYGAFNTVHRCTFRDGSELVDAVIRIKKKADIGDYAHKNRIASTRAAIDALSPIHAIPNLYFSSIDHEHKYKLPKELQGKGNDPLIVVYWAVIELLTDFEVNNRDRLIQYLRMLRDAAPRIHANGLYYFDWKHENMMLTVRNELVISDIDFYSFERVQAHPRIELTHAGTFDYMNEALKPFRWVEPEGKKGYIDTTTWKYDIDRLDNYVIMYYQDRVCVASI